MSVSIIKQINVSLGGSAQSLTDAVDTFLQGEGAIALYNADYFVPESARHTSGSVTLIYRKPSSQQCRAALFADSPSLGTAEAQINAWLQLNDTRRILATLLVTPNRCRQTDPLQLMVIYTDSLLPSGDIYQSQAIIVRATADAAPGATVIAQLLTYHGADATTVQALNRGPLTWRAGRDAYGYLEAFGDGVLQCFPVGCNA
jgi:hypothetical protein